MFPFYRGKQGFKPIAIWFQSLHAALWLDEFPLETMTEIHATKQMDSLSFPIEWTNILVHMFSEITIEKNIVAQQ